MLYTRVRQSNHWRVAHTLWRSVYQNWYTSRMFMPVAFRCLYKCRFALLQPVYDFCCKYICIHTDFQCEGKHGTSLHMIHLSCWHLQSLRWIGSIYIEITGFWWFEVHDNIFNCRDWWMELLARLAAVACPTWCGRTLTRFTTRTGVRDKFAEYV